MRCGDTNADFVADLIHDGELRRFLLDEADFATVAVNQFRRPAESLLNLYAMRRPFSSEMIFRASSPRLVSDALHEGWHDLDDFYNRYSQCEIEKRYLDKLLRAGTVANVSRIAVWIREVRAFLVEHDFQMLKYKGVESWPAFSGLDEIIQVVEQYYDAERPEE